MTTTEATKKIIYKPGLKAQKVWKEKESAKYRILEGAIRSSKSYLADTMAISEIQKLPNNTKILISGYSITSVARNVIDSWKEMIDPYNVGLFRNVKDTKDDYLTINWRGLRGKKFYIRGSGKENDYKQIQGATFDYWLADEAARHHEKFIDMAMTRLSMDHARAVWTLNPDSPYHFMKKRFIDNPRLYIEDSNGFSELKRWVFFLEDNPSLTKRYIDSLKELYTGLFYQRYVESKWVIAEGTIYDFFSDSNIIHKIRPRADYYVVGVDYGTGNPTCFILFGVNPRSFPKIWAEKEFYWDSKKMQRQKTDSEYSHDMKIFLNKTEETLQFGEIIPRYIFIDPSAASFELQLKRDGFRSVRHADNDVIDGIRTQARMLKGGEYMIGEYCVQTIEDYAGYVWDEKAQLRGIDAPLKINDHTKDVERYVLHTMFGKSGHNYKNLATW